MYVITAKNTMTREKNQNNNNYHILMQELQSLWHSIQLQCAMMTNSYIFIMHIIYTKDKNYRNSSERDKARYSQQLIHKFFITGKRAVMTRAIYY